MLDRSPGEDLQDVLDKALEENPALKETLELFQLSDDYYRAAVNSLSKTVEFTNDTSNPGEEEHDFMD